MNPRRLCFWHGPTLARPLALTLTLTLALGLVAGCTALLPRSRTESPTFQSFDAARQAVESLVPGKSGLPDLTALGLDPAKQPNITILARADIVRRAVSGSALGKEDIDTGIMTCLNARDACRGWELDVASITRERVGNFWSDFFNFHRRTQTSGWRFNALILLVNNVVVYRAWGGQPVVDEVEVHTNPLGPLQDLGPAVVTPK